MKNIVFLRTNRIDPDPRVEKEVQSLLENDELKISAVVWDRGEKYKNKTREIVFPEGKISVLQFGLPATWGGGMKANFKPMFQFEWKLFWWLIFHHHEYDCIHACDLLTGLPAIWPCKLFHKKIVYDIFDYYAATQHGSDFILNIFRKLEDNIINQADVTIICSEKRVEQIRGTTPKKLIVLHNAPSMQQLSVDGIGKVPLQGNITKQKVKVVYVGNLVEDRFILQAIDAIKDMPHEVEFHIGGYGALEDAIAEAAEEYDNIYYYRKMNYNEVILLEKRCDIMIAFYDPAVPNHAYAAPNKFYEALALGKPLIMFRNTGMDSVIEENGIGCVCDPSVQSIREAISNLLAMKGQWPEMGDKGRHIFLAEYSWDIMKKRIQKVYRELMENDDE